MNEKETCRGGNETENSTVDDLLSVWWLFISALPWNKQKSKVLFLSFTVFVLSTASPPLSHSFLFVLRLFAFCHFFKLQTFPRSTLSILRICFFSCIFSLYFVRVNFLSLGFWPLVRHHLINQTINCVTPLKRCTQDQTLQLCFSYEHFDAPQLRLWLIHYRV